MLRHEQGHLGAPCWPIAAKVKAINPHLTLEREKTINPAALTTLGSARALVQGGQGGEAGSVPRKALSCHRPGPEPGQARVGSSILPRCPAKSGRGWVGEATKAAPGTHTASGRDVSGPFDWLQHHTYQHWMTLWQMHQVTGFRPGSRAGWGSGACRHTPASAWRLCRQLPPCLLKETSFPSLFSPPPGRW